MPGNKSDISRASTFSNPDRNPSRVGGAATGAATSRRTTGENTLARWKNITNIAILQAKLEELWKQNNLLRGQCKETRIETQRELKDQTAGLRQQYQAQLEQLRRDLKAEKSREIRVAKTQITREWEGKVSAAQKSRDKDVSRMRDRMNRQNRSMDGGIGTELAKLKSELDGTKIRNQYMEVELQKCQQELRKVNDESKRQSDKLATLQKRHVHELMEELKSKEVKMKKLEAEKTSRMPVQPQNCKKCDRLQFKISCLENAKSILEQRCSELETKIREIEPCHPAAVPTVSLQFQETQCNLDAEVQSLLKVLQLQVEDAVKQREHLSQKVHDLSERNELLEFQLLEFEEAQKAAPEKPEHEEHSHPAGPNIADVSEDEAFCSMDESSLSESMAPLSDEDLRVRFALLQFKTQLNSNDKRTITEMKKRFEQLELESKSTGTPRNHVRFTYLGAERGSVSPTVEHETLAELRNELELQKQEASKLQYMQRASDGTERRQKDCIVSLKQQLESMRDAREDELRILKDSLERYSWELDEYRKKEAMCILTTKHTFTKQTQCTIID